MKHVLVGIVSVVMCGAAQLVAAQPAPRVKAERLGEAAVLSMSSGDLMVTQTIARDAVQLRLRVTAAMSSRSRRRRRQRFGRSRQEEPELFKMDGSGVSRRDA